MEVAPWPHSPLARLFDAEVFSCVVGLVKPEPAIYTACLTSLDLEAHECLFVGDDGSDELAGARAVGMSPVFVSAVMAELWPERIQERLAQCNHHVRIVPEVLALVGIQEASGTDG